jgi:arylsulfatase A-like enzyme
MDRPNVAVICCDDLGYGDLGCYGAAYDTPNVDALADEGIRFTDWHSNGPVCSPTRASLLTGQYPHRVGVAENAPQGRPETDPDVGLSPEATTLADRLGDAGYRTGQGGKWHLGMTVRDDPIAHGFDTAFGFRSGCVDYYSHTMMWLQGNGVPPYHDLWDDREEVWRNGEFLTDLITDRAVEFVESAAGDPFFAYVAYNAPHYPMHAPTEHFDRFDHLDDAERRRQAAMIAGIDDGVGAIRDALERAGIADETIIVVTSDHGPSHEVRNHLDGATEPYTGGSTGGHRGHKFSLFEGGTRVPAILSVPGADGGATTDALGLSMDVFPTVLDYCGVDHDPVDGASLRPVVEGDAETPHDRVYWVYGDQAAVRDGDWKLLLDPVAVDADTGSLAPAVEGPFLADLDADPGETRNRADDRPDLAADLAADARAWRETVQSA